MTTEPIVAVSNAQEARASRISPSTVIVVANESEQRFWHDTLAPHADRPPALIAERGRKGNLLGALQAIKRLDSDADVDQLVMLFGTGSRLSPFTQALANKKTAFPLPDADRGADGITIGELAIRSSSGWPNSLRRAGFDGILVRWGDEILIPSVDLGALPDLSGADVVRLGSRLEPTELLAEEKEWLLADRRTGELKVELSRQPLEPLRVQIEREGDCDLFVNLGTFAATPAFFGAAVTAFSDLVDDAGTQINWDPYFWQALHTPTDEEWRALLEEEAANGRPGIADLSREIPTFFERVKDVRSRFQASTGRPLSVRVLDIGTTYWVDVGNHEALRGSLRSIFEPTPDGDVVRALLGLPDRLGEGGSFVADSEVSDGSVVENSLVIGSQLGAASNLRSSIALGSRIGALDASLHSAAIGCAAGHMELGDEAIAFRHVAEKAIVEPGGSLTTVRTDDDTVTVRLNGKIGSGDYENVVAPNDVSFAELSQIVADVDAISLQETLRTEIESFDPGAGSVA